MQKVYFLSTCSTCSRIMSELNLDGFDLQDIKKDKITDAQLDRLKSLSGSYEALFSKVAMKYKALGLKDKNLKENDFRKFILEEYTFLKRPVFEFDDAIFIGNSKKTIEQLKSYLGQ